MPRAFTSWLRARPVAVRKVLGPRGREEGDAGQRDPLWSRRKTKVYFDNQDLDVYLSFILARAAARGASLGESIVAASQVRSRDPDSWAQAWSRVAIAVERHAGSLAELDPVGARDAYLRATRPPCGDLRAGCGERPFDGRTGSRPATSSGRATPWPLLRRSCSSSEGRRWPRTRGCGSVRPPPDAGGTRSSPNRPAPSGFAPPIRRTRASPGRRSSRS